MVDEGLRPADRRAVAEFLGISSAKAPRSGSALGGDFGRYTHHDRRVTVDRALPFDRSERVFSHELGHAIDKRTFGQAIPTKGIEKELRRVYEDLNTGANFKPGRGATPATFGYKGADTDRELIAEAIRAYMVDRGHIRGEKQWKSG